MDAVPVGSLPARGLPEKQYDGTTYSLAGRFTGDFHRSGLDTVQVTCCSKPTAVSKASGAASTIPPSATEPTSVRGNQLVVDDSCAWTANFDWSLIFDGTYDLQFLDASKIRIRRTQGSVTDEYNLYRLLR